MNQVLVCAVLGYFDPGAGSLLLQSLVGGTAGLLVFGQYLWMRITQRRRDRKATFAE